MDLQEIQAADVLLKFYLIYRQISIWILSYDSSAYAALMSPFKSCSKILSPFYNARICTFMLSNAVWCNPRMKSHSLTDWVCAALEKLS